MIRVQSAILFCVVFGPATGLMAQTFSCAASGSHGVQLLRASSVATASAAGFDFGTVPDHFDGRGCSAAKDFYLSIPAKDGNYRVTVTLGGSVDAVTTVRSEARRLMLARVATKAGKISTASFVVNVRTPEVAGQTKPDGSPQVVKRKPRELNSLDWDSKITLEFAGDRPSLVSVRVEPADVPTVYLAGDSTVVDQDNEPWAAWGQMLPAFFGDRVAISNQAESGETIRSFDGELRFAKIFSTIRKGDYLFFQFAHNDQKPGGGYVSPEMYTGLLTRYIAKAREIGATPVLVTSMNRRTFDAEGHITDTLAPYPELMRKVAAEQKVALIDLNAMSKTLYEAIGEPTSRSLFVYAAPNTYPRQPEALHDDTHFNGYGAYELARCVVRGIVEDRLPLASLLRDQHPHFDPQHPDTASAVALPEAGFYDLEKPYER
ncbi:Lysophospholipase L1 [Bryocella elongata]|uniref:Lysophospholipase L1 n=1 Tax=Bryocella elongata TaxID=863522 RepID=A0A1H6CGS9_9BACT|nr:rhamnogalacturonan acetylesterase [Bryocella elongata]SEG72220.1 Lysophospholipase L1 [Bryocella elongata]